MVWKMKKIFLIIFGLLFSSNLANAQSQRNPCYNPNTTNGQFENCVGVGVSDPLPVSNLGFPSGATQIAGNAIGTTSAVVGTLTATATTTANICGFNVSALGGTATVGPIVVAGLLGGSQTYYMAATAAGNTITVPFSPCLAASAINTNITITTTADGTASNVAVNSWGFIK